MCDRPWAQSKQHRLIVASLALPIPGLETDSIATFNSLIVQLVYRSLDNLAFVHSFRSLLLAFYLVWFSLSLSLCACVCVCVLSFADNNSHTHPPTHMHLHLYRYIYCLLVTLLALSSTHHTFPCSWSFRRARRFSRILPAH